MRDGYYREHAVGARLSGWSFKRDERLTTKIIDPCRFYNPASRQKTKSRSDGERFPNRFNFLCQRWSLSEPDRDFFKPQTV